MKTRNRKAPKLKSANNPNKATKGKYIAYLEEICSHQRRLIAHGVSLKQVNDQLAKLSPEERTQVVLHYVEEGATDTIEVHYDLPAR